MDHVLFYGILGVSLLLGALMYYANMAEEKPIKEPAAPDPGSAPHSSQPDVVEGLRNDEVSDYHGHPGLPSLVSAR